MLTHRNLVANAFQIGAWSREEDGAGGILGVLPFFHAYGLTVGLLTGLAKAATVHLHPRFEVKPAINLLERYRIDLVPAVPAMLGGPQSRITATAEGPLVRPRGGFRRFGHWTRRSGPSLLSMAPNTLSRGTVCRRRVR